MWCSIRFDYIQGCSAFAHTHTPTTHVDTIHNNEFKWNILEWYIILMYAVMVVTPISRRSTNTQLLRTKCACLCVFVWTVR